MNPITDLFVRLGAFFKDMILLLFRKPIVLPDLPPPPPPDPIKTLPPLPPIPPLSMREKVYQKAYMFLGKSLVPPNDDPDVGCAISVTVLLKEKCGINIKETTSTYELLHELIASPYVEEVFSPLFGDIIISATDTSLFQNPPFPHGHTGIVGKVKIMSNNSSNGLWEDGWTLPAWDNHYRKLGGYPTRFFRPK